jgi:cell wall-associated NlpC family hydrolase
MNKYITSIIVVLLMSSVNSNAKIFDFSFGVKSNKIASTASREVGSYYKRGVPNQCANFVASVVSKSGGRLPESPSLARSWLKWGKPVSKSSMRPGDIIITQRGGANSRYGHILIYKGNGKAIHRSTSSKPIQEIDIDYYSNRILGVRRA